MFRRIELDVILDRPIRRVAKPRNTTQKLPLLQLVLAQKCICCLIIPQIAGERRVGPKFHHGTAHAKPFCKGKRFRVAKKDKPCSTQHVDRFGHGGVGRDGRGTRLLWRQRDSINSVRFARHVSPMCNIVFGNQRRPGTVQQEVTIGIGILERVGTLFGDFQFRKPRPQQVVDTVVKIARVKHDLRVRQMRFQDPQDAGCVCDVADIDSLPRRADEDTRGSVVGCTTGMEALRAARPV